MPHSSRAIVKLLRVNKALVFQDLDSIELGKRWREQAGRTLAEAHLVVSFWCVHSSHSSKVESEYKSALERGKDLLPVLLDATPLPVDLTEFQWIDFRRRTRRGMNEQCSAWWSAVEGLPAVHP
jgi:TIR domain